MTRLPALAGLAALALAACAATAPPAPEAAEAACGAATAAHVGKPAASVSAARTGPTADGGGTVTVTDAAAGAGERVHVCTLRADGSVAALVHV